MLEARDPDGATGTDAITLQVGANTPPTAQIITPDGSRAFYSDVPIAFSAVVADAEDDADTLTVTWTDETGAAIDLDGSPAADGSLVGSATLLTGDHEITLTVTDAVGASAQASVAFTVGGPNAAPTCALDASVGVVALGAPITFVGSAADDDHVDDLLDLVVTSDLDGDLVADTLDQNGAVEYTTAALSAGEHTITLTVTDETGASCVAETVVTVSARPTVTIASPTADSVHVAGDVVSFAAVVADDDTPADALTLSWASDLDGVVDVGHADAGGVASFELFDLSRGTHTVTLTATDAHGLSASADITLVVHGLPSAPVVAIGPADPLTADDLVASVVTEAVDPDGDAITYTWAWTVDGVAAPFTTDTVPHTATARGQVWEVVVTPHDTHAAGTIGAATVTIGDTPPTLDAVTLGPDPAREGDVLSCAPGAASDADADAISLTYAWTVDGALLDEATPILADDAWDRGDVVTCAVTPIADGLAGDPVPSNAVTIANSAPSVATATITPDPPRAGQELTCAVGGFADADGDDDQSTITWTVDGMEVGTGPTLSGGFVGGQTVGCTVIPSDGIDAGSPVSDQVVVANTAPVATNVTLTPETATETSLLTCTPTGSDVDGDDIEWTYTWTVDGVEVAASTNSINGGSFDAGQTVTCTATPSDTVDSGVGLTSNAVTIENTAPVVTSVNIGPMSPTAADTITCTATVSDVDEDDIALLITWTIDGVPIDATGPTLTAADFDKGDLVRCIVTPDDGTVTGEPVTSVFLTVQDAPPVVTSVVLTPSPAYETSTLTCTPTGSDLDDDTISWSYTWQVHGSSLVGAESSTLTGSSFKKGDDVRCIARPTADDVDGEPMPRTPSRSRTRRPVRPSSPCRRPTSWATRI